MEIETKIAIFKGKKIRKVIYRNEWWFSVVDAVEALTDSGKMKKSWKLEKSRMISANFIHKEK